MEVTGGWGKLHEEFQVCTLHQTLSGDQMRENDADWTCSTHQGDDISVRNFSRKIRRDRPLGRPKCKWEDKISLKEILCESVDWIKLAEDSPMRAHI